MKVVPLKQVHSQALREALLSMLEANPALNKTKYNGKTWVSLRQERIVVVLNHVRRLAKDPNMGNAVQKLNLTNTQPR